MSAFQIIEVPTSQGCYSIRFLLKAIGTSQIINNVVTIAAIKLALGEADIIQYSYYTARYGFGLWRGGVGACKDWARCQI